MARFTDEQLDRVKREVSIADLVRRRGVELRGHGENLIGLCPFHDDHDPSLVVTPSKNLWNCLGACQRGGDVIRWVEVSERVSFRRAVELLIGGYEPSSQPQRWARKADARCPVTEEMSDAEMLASVAGYYNHVLHTSDDAKKYLERRAVLSDETIEHFQIGFADRSLGTLLPSPELRSGKELRARLAKLGIYREETGREHFNGAIVFPIFDASGEVVEIYGRKIRDDIRHKHGSHLYLPGPHRGIWNREALTESKDLILCEAILDALTFWVHGFRNVTCAYGVNGLTDELQQAIKACAIERVLIAYDRDEAGDKAAEILALSLAREGIGAFRVVFPRLMDANDYARKVMPATQSLGVLLKAAEWMGGPKHRGTIGPLPSALLVRDNQKTPSTPIIEPVNADPLPSLAAVAAPEPNQPLQQPPAPVVPDRSLSVSDYSTIDLSFGDRRYRVRGLDKNMSLNQMKVVMRVARGELFFLDTLDLIAARHRAAFVKQAAIDLGVKEEVIKHDIASVYRQLEQTQEQMIRKSLEPKAARPSMSEEDLTAAMALCRDPLMFDRLLADYERCGVVGERVNKLVAFLGAVSRLLDDPIAIIIQSSSAAGKTKLMDAVLDLVPEEERERYSAMTGQSLFYFEGKSLQHKILAISEEEGAARASYALKLLQSEGELTIASTGKNPTSGRLETQEYHVEGPVMIFLTTTAVEIDEELLNRCIVLTVDEDREQTRAIHELQRRGETLEGLIAREERASVLNLWRNAQRLLRPVRVVNPFASRLRFPDGSTRMRRDHTKYLALIRSIALAKQHQRERKTHPAPSGPIEYIEVTMEDIALANDLAHEVLGRSLDELAPQTRRLLDVLDKNVLRECARRGMARCDYRFMQREVREWSGWTDFQVKTHLRKLVEMEYVLLHRGGRGQSFVYELLYDGAGKTGRPFLMGLIDATTLGREDAKGEWTPR